MRGWDGCNRGMPHANSLARQKYIHMIRGIIPYAHFWDYSTDCCSVTLERSELLDRCCLSRCFSNSGPEMIWNMYTLHLPTVGSVSAHSGRISILFD